MKYQSSFILISNIFFAFLLLALKIKLFSTNKITLILLANTLLGFFLSAPFFIKNRKKIRRNALALVPLLFWSIGYAVAYTTFLLNAAVNIADFIILKLIATNIALLVSINGLEKFIDVKWAVSCAMLVVLFYMISSDINIYDISSMQNLGITFVGLLISETSIRFYNKQEFSKYGSIPVYIFNALFLFAVSSAFKNELNLDKLLFSEIFVVAILIVTIQSLYSFGLKYTNRTSSIIISNTLVPISIILDSVFSLEEYRVEIFLMAVVYFLWSLIPNDVFKRMLNPSQ